MKKYTNFIKAAGILVLLIVVYLFYSKLSHEWVEYFYRTKALVFFHFLHKPVPSLKECIQVIDQAGTFFYLLASISVVWITGLYRYTTPERRRIFFGYYVVSVLLFFLRWTRVEAHYNILDAVFYDFAYAPNIYRILLPSLSWCLVSIFPCLSWKFAAGVWNFIFILAAVPLFHRYVRIWFTEAESVLLTYILVCFIPVSFLYDYPSDFLELSVFITGYYLIREKKDILLMLLIFIATFDKETSALLCVSYFISNIHRDQWKKTSFKSFLCVLAWVIPTCIVRILKGIVAYRTKMGLESVIVNFQKLLSDLNELSLFLFFMGVFSILLVIFTRKKLDSFLARNLVTCLFFVILTFFTARVYEVRIYYPLLPLIIPASFYALLHEKGR